jgi:CRP-like cAMP-binding protein
LFFQVIVDALEPIEQPPGAEIIKQGDMVSEKMRIETCVVCGALSDMLKKCTLKVCATPACFCCATAPTLLGEPCCATAPTLLADCPINFGKILLDKIMPYLHCRAITSTSWILESAKFSRTGELSPLLFSMMPFSPPLLVLTTRVLAASSPSKLVQTATEAMSFGELALMYNSPRAATVTAKETSKMFKLDRMTFKFILMDTTIRKRELHKGFLEKVSILSHLSDAERLQVSDALVQKSFANGEAIITEGEAGDLLYILEEGSVSCTKAGVNVGDLESGQYFGEVALLTDRPRQATVKANGDVKVLSLERKTFKVPPPWIANLWMCTYFGLCLLVC